MLWKVNASPILFVLLPKGPVMETHSLEVVEQLIFRQ